jgi:Fe-S oxidoreductase
LVQAAKFARDPRDQLDRGDVIESSGVDNCMSCYRCEQVCPLSIPILAEAVDPLRSMAARGPTGRASFPLAFAENIRKNVYVHTASLFVRTRGLIGSLRSLPMALRMLAAGKMKLVSRPNEHARAGIAALFKEAGQKEI